MIRAHVYSVLLRLRRMLTAQVTTIFAFWQHRRHLLWRRTRNNVVCHQQQLLLALEQTLHRHLLRRGRPHDRLVVALHAKRIARQHIIELDRVLLLLWLLLLNFLLARLVDQLDQIELLRVLLVFLKLLGIVLQNLIDRLHQLRFLHINTVLVRGQVLCQIPLGRVVLHTNGAPKQLILARVMWRLVASVLLLLHLRRRRHISFVTATVTRSVTRHCLRPPSP